MAIKKLTAMTAIGDMTPLLEILQAHAVPKYFDRVELVLDEGTSASATQYYISCYIGSVEFLRIYASCGGSGTGLGGFQLTTAAGATKRLGITYSNSYYIGSVYTCSNGILLIPNASSSAVALIAKDASGKTCFTCITGYGASNTIPNGSGIENRETYWGIWAASVDDTALTNYDVYLNNADPVTGKYALCPIYTENSAVQGAWTPIVRQFYDVELPFRMTMDGKVHLVNRGIVILDS